MSGQPDALADGRAEREARARQLLAALAEADSQEQGRIREDLVAAHLGLVHAMAAKFAGRGEPMDDLVQAGSIGLLRAIDGFDPQLGTEFGSYAVSCILGSIRQHFRDRSGPLAISRQLKERIRAIDRVIDERTAETGRSPTVRELASALDLRAEQVVEAMDASLARSMVPLDAIQQGGHPVAEVLGQVDADLEAVADRQAVAQALQSMPEEERQALLLTTIEGLSQSAAGARLGVSQMQVHRLRVRALDRLRSATDPNHP